MFKITTIFLTLVFMTSCKRWSTHAEPQMMAETKQDVTFLFMHLDKGDFCFYSNTLPKKHFPIFQKRYDLVVPELTSLQMAAFATSDLVTPNYLDPQLFKYRLSTDKLIQKSLVNALEKVSLVSKVVSDALNPAAVLFTVTGYLGVTAATNTLATGGLATTSGLMKVAGGRIFLWSGVALATSAAAGVGAKVWSDKIDKRNQAMTEQLALSEHEFNSILNPENSYGVLKNIMRVAKETEGVKSKRCPTGFEIRNKIQL